MSGVYWSLAGLSLLLPSDQVVAQMRVVVDNSSSKNSSLLDWLFTCWDDEAGGFGGNTGQSAHLLYTLSAVQILALTNRLGDNNNNTKDARLETERIVKFVQSLQQPDGSFVGDAWGEVDTRFTYCALSTLSLLGQLEAVNVGKAAEYILACRNLDGGFGCVIGAESHAGMYLNYANVL